MSDLIGERLAACTEGIARAIDATAENLIGIEGQAAEKRIFLCNSVLLMSVSITEEGIRELLKEYLTLIEELIRKPYENRSALIHANIDKASLLLKRHNKTKDLASAKSLISTMHHFLQDQENYALLKTDITMNEANLKSDEITNLLKQIGLADIWRSLAGSPSIKEHLGEEATEKCQTYAIQKWNNFYLERDAIIHRLSQASGWAPDKIIEHCQYIKLVLIAMSNILRDDLSEFVLQKQRMAEAANADAGPDEPNQHQKLDLIKIAE